MGSGRQCGLTHSKVTTIIKKTLLIVSFIFMLYQYLLRVLVAVHFFSFSSYVKNMIAYNWVEWMFTVRLCASVLHHDETNQVFNTMLGRLAYETKACCSVSSLSMMPFVIELTRRSNALYNFVCLLSFDDAIPIAIILSWHWNIHVELLNEFNNGIDWWSKEQGRVLYLIPPHSK